MTGTMNDILIVCDQQLEKTYELITSCKNFASMRDMDYLAVMISMRNHPGICKFMGEMTTFLDKHGIKAKSWIPNGEITGDNIFYLMAQVSRIFGDCLVLHDIPFDANQANIIIKAAKRVQSTSDTIILQKQGLFKKEYHVGVTLPRNMYQVQIESLFL